MTDQCTRRIHMAAYETLRLTRSYLGILHYFILLDALCVSLSVRSSQRLGERLVAGHYVDLPHLPAFVNAAFPDSF